MAKVTLWRCGHCGAEGTVPDDQRVYTVMRSHAALSPTCPFDANEVFVRVEEV